MAEELRKGEKNLIAKTRGNISVGLYVKHNKQECLTNCYKRPTCNN